MLDAAASYRLVNVTVANHNQGRSGAYAMTVAYDHPGAGSLEITNCIFFHNSGAVWVPAEFSVNVRNSLFYGAAGGVELEWGARQYGESAEPMTALAPSNLPFVDPRFTNAAAGDYTLGAGSPAIDRGIDVSGVVTDLLGHLRQQGVAPDLGPYERP